jgi:NAD(P)H-hydrate epimerase
MQKVLTAAQMREVDRLTTERYGIPSIILMENAAQAAALAITEKFNGSVKDRSIVVLCGKGNNGGDGAALARILTSAGADVLVLLFGRIDDTRGDARSNFDAAEQVCEVDEIDSIDEWKELWCEQFQNRDMIVDAIFGTGLDRPVGEWPGVVIDDINANISEHKPIVLSIDIPSGLNSDLAEPIGPAFRSDLTVTFTAPKAANILPPASRHNGKLLIADIGSPRELIDEVDSDLFLAEGKDAERWLSATAFTDNSYKNKRGHALIIAGSKNYTGAAVLCGDAAIRSGVGLVTLAVPEGSRESVVARVSPEVMVRGISETAGGSAAEAAFEEITEFLENVDVVAVGSGLSSKEDETRRFVRKTVEQRTTPVVIDADGLTALSPFDISGPAELPLILTPHEGEFMRLLGTDDKSVIENRVEAVRRFATDNNVILVLKGERVLIGAPDGRVVVNPTGNAGLGKAGNGDTLTGILTGFAAQAVQMRIDMFETVVAAVYIAGLAGDKAEEKYGKRVMTASDVRDCLADVFTSLSGSDK